MEGNNQKYGGDGGGHSKGSTAVNLMLRLLALAATVTAAIVMGVAKETKTLPVQITPKSPPLFLPVPAKWQHVSAFVYFAVVNGIACSYAALSLVSFVFSKKRSGGGGRKGFLTTLILTLDLLMVPLLASGCGAAGAIGVIGYNGNSHLHWNKVCNVYGNFCRHVASALIVSGIGTLAFLALILTEAFKP